LPEGHQPGRIGEGPYGKSRRHEVGSRAESGEHLGNHGIGPDEHPVRLDRCGYVSIAEVPDKAGEMMRVLPATPHVEVDSETYEVRSTASC
jgi:hypothetical protein